MPLKDSDNVFEWKGKTIYLNLKHGAIMFF
jgi:hypothetical protein